MAITNAKSPIASIKPAPISAFLCKLSAAEGFLANPESNEENTKPTPIAAPAMPNAISPTPRYLYVDASIKDPL